MNILKPKVLTVPKFLPLSISAFLLVLYASALIRSDEIAHLGMSALYLLAIAKLLHQRSPDLNLETSLPSAFLGIGILIFVSGLLINQGDSETVWRSMPLVAGVGISLLISNFKSFQYWQEFLILFFLGLPKLLIGAVYDPSPLTAQAAGLTLWYSGFDAQVINKVYVMLSTGGVKVFAGCSGLESVCYTLGLSVICLLLYPISRRYLYWVVPLVAIIIGFSINVLRVALLAVLNAWQYKRAFIYWHEGDGSLIFGMIAVLIFVTFYYFLPQKQEAQTTKTLA